MKFKEKMVEYPTLKWWKGKDDPSMSTMTKLQEFQPQVSTPNSKWSPWCLLSFSLLAQVLGGSRLRDWDVRVLGFQGFGYGTLEKEKKKKGRERKEIWNWGKREAIPVIHNNIFYPRVENWTLGKNPWSDSIRPGRFKTVWADQYREGHWRQLLNPTWGSG